MKQRENRANTWQVQTIPNLSACLCDARWLLAACVILLLATTGCVGPVQDKVGTNFRSAWIASRAGLATPYADYPNSQGGRNAFIDDFVSVKNIQFHNYVAAIRRGSSYGELAADGSRLVLDSLAAITGGAGTKAALAAASAGITGFSGSVKKDVLFDQAIPTFIQKMEELRANKLADITNKKKLSINEYSRSEAYNDVEEYGANGTFDAALRDINTKTGQAAATAKSELSTAKGDTVSAAADSSGTIQRIILPPSNPNAKTVPIVTPPIQTARIEAIKKIKALKLDPAKQQTFLDDVRQASDIETVNALVDEATAAKINP
jgi:hypothetical protein